MRSLLFSLFLLAASAFGADVTGTWTGTALANGESHPLHLMLKQQGETITGSGGPDESKQYPMQKGTVKGDKVAFDIVLEEGLLHFEFTAGAEEMTGTVQHTGPDGSESGTASIKRKT